MIKFEEDDNEIEMCNVYLQHADKGKRLDIALVEHTDHFSRSQIQRLLSQGNITVDGRKSFKSGYLVKGRETVSIVVPSSEITELEAENIPLKILYENTDLLVIDKPAGMVVHPGPGHSNGTLVNAVLGHDSNMTGVGGDRRPGIVHRLDKDTSGIIIVAKNDYAHRFLQAQFKERSVVKIYLGLVDGKPPSSKGRIETGIGRDTKFRMKMSVYSEEDLRARSAVTRYSTKETLELACLLEIHPITGRTHQIRVHMAYLGCPIVGDAIYGMRKSVKNIYGLQRHFLHAHKLSIAIPNKGTMEFVSKLPRDLEEAITLARG